MIFYFLSISVVSLYVVGRFSFQKASGALMQRTFDQLISVRVEKKNRLNDFFKQRENDFNLLISSPVISSIYNSLNDCGVNSDTICTLDHDSEVFLEGFVKGNSNLKAIFFIQEGKGSFIFDGHRFYLDNSLSAQFVSKLSVPGNHELITKNGNHRLFISRNIHESGGVIAIELDDVLDDIMLESNSYNGLGKSGEVYIVGPDNLMRSSSRFIRNSKLKVKVETQAVTKSFAGKTGVGIVDDYRGIKVLSSYSPLGIAGFNWVIMAEIDESEAMIPIVGIENSIVFLSIVVSLLLLGLVAALANFLLLPLRKLKSQAEEIYAGKYGVVVDSNLDNEIGDLINAFNRMSTQLKDQEDRLEFEKIKRLTSLIDGQELERSRLSRELHDGLAQQILALRFEIEKLNNENFAGKKDMIRETILGIIAEIRSVSNDLMPSVLVNYGLKKSLNELMLKINSGGLINFSLVVEVEEDLLPKKTSLYLYRIVQETLNNSLKYAKAQEFRVIISLVQDYISVDISDDGVGFDKRFASHGNGLKNIDYRVNILGGGYELITEPGKGVRFNILIPL